MTILVYKQHLSSQKPQRSRESYLLHDTGATQKSKSKLHQRDLEEGRKRRKSFERTNVLTTSALRSEYEEE
jgi:hypothetical protein